MKAREAKSVRETDSLGSIFASTTPAVVLANPAYEKNPISGALSVDPTPETLPLSALEFKRRVQPKYPQQAANRKLSGWVELRFLVTAQGNTENIQVTDSEPKGSFENAATKAISKWRFKPVMVNGVPTEKYSAVRLRFNP